VRRFAGSPITGFASSNPVVMFDSKTLATIKTIEVKGNRTAISTTRSTTASTFEPRQAARPLRQRADGSIAGTIDDLGGAPEEAATDARAPSTVDIEDAHSIAVVDAKTLTADALRPGGKGDGCAGPGAGCEEPGSLRGPAAIPRTCDSERQGRQDPRDPSARRRQRRRPCFNPKTMKLSARTAWHAEHRQEKSPTSVRGGTDGEDHERGQDADAR